MIFVRVSINNPAIEGDFDYHLPPELEGKVSLGHMLKVPFRNQDVQGIVVGTDIQPVVANTRAVLDLLDPVPVVSAAQIELARQLADHTLQRASSFIGMMLPAGISQQTDMLYSRTGQLSPEKLSETQQKILKLLDERGALRGRQLSYYFKHTDWQRSARALLKQRVISAVSILPPPAIRAKFIRTAQLCATPEIVMQSLDTLGRGEVVRTRRKAALQFIMDEAEPVAVNWVYAASGCNLSDLESLAEAELILLQETEIFRDPLYNAEHSSHVGTAKNQRLILSDEQQAALVQIRQAFEPGDGAQANKKFLLYGVTGSGKTEVYLHASLEAVKRGKTVIVMVPEIALTQQIVRRFLFHFPGQVGLVHSKLSDGERYDTWRRARAGKIKIIIGPRSALFTPMASPGLIIVDECHDNSYNQAEPPFYDAVFAAEAYAQITGAVCILGSATPSVSLRYRSLVPATSVPRGQLKEIRLRNRFSAQSDGSGSRSLPPVSVVDMREELKSGNRGIFSRELIQSLSETIQRGEQALLFLNRRGTATYIFCRECGFVARCPRCDIPLTYHTGVTQAGEGQQLLCHRCGYTRKMISTCPECKKGQVRAFGLGSEKVETDVKALLPSARVMRWDLDTTREKDAHEMILFHFANHQADILVGTQMISKGLDFPLVTLVGIILADVGLTLPDPFAYEHSFQTLTQVAGRSGRSSLGGKVVLQTFMPENPVIQMAARHDFDAFFEWDLANREKLSMPPFFSLLRLEYRHTDPREAENEAMRFAGMLKNWISDEHRAQTTLIGPVPCFFAREGGIYRWQIVVRSPDPVNLIRGREPQGWRIEVDPANLL